MVCLVCWMRIVRHDEPMRLDWNGMNGLIDPILKPNPPNKPNHIKYSLDTSQHLIQHQQTPFHRQGSNLWSFSLHSFVALPAAASHLSSRVLRIFIVCLAYRVCDLPNCTNPSQRCFAQSWFDSYRAIARQRDQQRDTRDASRPPR